MLEHGILQPTENGVPLCACDYCEAAKRVIVRMRRPATQATNERNAALLAAVKHAAETGGEVPEGARPKVRTVVTADTSFLDGVPAGQRWQARVQHYAARVGNRTYSGRRDGWTNI
ncbi:hypothetical protein SAMN04487847_0395 [Microbacterium sp. cf332]|nr:hypothetical protein SAMN04487847_0395 [Microbacterium sp. cf332]